jgi:tetratricopeptide (TPR) repeat protein
MMYLCANGRHEVPERIHHCPPHGAKGARFMSPTSDIRSRVSALVRSAEKQLLLARYDAALDQLRRAQKLDPQNQYIQVMIQRAELAGQSAPSQGLQGSIPAPGHQSPRYLSVTVGAEHPGGVLRDHSQQETLSIKETSRRIRQLTDTAHVLLNRGLKESAFDTLMRAYLLDPLNPDVLSCEKRVLPAWEDLRRVRESTPAKVAPSTPAERLQSLRREELSARSAQERRLWQTVSGPPPRATDSGSEPPAPGELASHGKSTRRRKS